MLTRKSALTISRFRKFGSNVSVIKLSPRVLKQLASSDVSTKRLVSKLARIQDQ